MSTDLANKGKVVLAYSSGLATSFGLHWIQERGWAVIELTVHLRGKKDLDAIKPRDLTHDAHAASAPHRSPTTRQPFIYP